jgi:hypothetical protein
MKFITLCIAFFITNFSINAQTRSDLGLIYGVNDLHRLNIEFRKPLNETYKLKFGYIQGGSSGEFWGYSGELITVSDSLIIERFNSRSQLQFTLSTGIERRLKTSMFSISADLLISYLQIKDELYNEVRELGDNGNWVKTAGIYTMLNPARALRKTNFLNLGLQFKFSMDIPIEESFFLHLFVGQIISTPIYLSETIVKDPLSEFKPQKASFYFNSTSQAGIGLRYRFKK